MSSRLKRGSPPSLPGSPHLPSFQKGDWAAGIMIGPSWQM